MTTRFTKQLHPVLASRAKGAKQAATDEQLAAINRYTLETVSADQVYVRTFWLAHNAIDRDGEVFPPKLLEDFARTLPGKGLFIKHPRSMDGDSGPGEGRWFSAKTVTMSQDEAREALRAPDLEWLNEEEDAVLLEASAYLASADWNVELREKIDLGIAGDVSIGFSASDLQFFNDDNGNEIAAVYQAPGEAMEGSLVWLGAQPGARAWKGAKTPDTSGDDDMSEEMKKALQRVEKQLEEKDAALKKLESEKTEGAKALDTLKTLREKACDEKASTDRLAELVANGKAYEDELVDQVVKCERHLKITGDSPEEEKAAKDLHRSLGVNRMKANLDRLQKQLPPGAQIDGGDPNATEADKDADDDLRDSSKTKAAIGA